MFLDDNHDDANNTNVTTQVDRLKDIYIPQRQKPQSYRGSGIRDQRLVFTRLPAADRRGNA